MEERNQMDTGETVFELRLSDNSALLQCKENAIIALNCRELMMQYTCAMKEIRTRFEILNTEYRVACQRNPIFSINTRLKSASSIIAKLDRKGLDLSVQNIEKHIHDVAGVRIICCYIDDIFALADQISHQEGIELIACKDYITNPKVNGYRSLHLILRVPVCFANQTKHMEVEVQIRTIAMDFWASLEHELKYKQKIASETQVISELKECADTISYVDRKMLKLRVQIEGENPMTQDELLLEKLRNFDQPLD